MLEFFDLDVNNGTASIYDSHITLNKTLLKYFEDAYKVRVGFDKDEKSIYIFLINKDYALSGEIPETSLISISTSKTYVRVCSRALIDHICKLFGLDIPKKSYLRYDASYDENKKAIVIKL